MSNGIKTKMRKMLQLFFFISLNDTITHFISSFYCFVASFVSLFDGMISSGIALSFVHGGIKRQTKTFNSFSVKLYLPSDVSFSDHFRVYLLCCVFVCVNLKELTLAQGKCRFCITSTAFALCQIVTVLKYEKKKISFPFRIYLFVFFVVIFLRFDGIDCINSAVFFCSFASFSVKNIISCLYDA